MHHVHESREKGLEDVAITTAHADRLSKSEPRLMNDEQIGDIRRFFRAWDVSWYSIGLAADVWLCVDFVVDGYFWPAAAAIALGCLYTWLLHRAITRFNHKESTDVDQV